MGLQALAIATQNVNTGASTSLLFWKNLQSLRDASAAGTLLFVERDAGRLLKRANIDLLVRNLEEAAADTVHTIIESLYAVRPVSWLPLGYSDVSYELKLVATITWSFNSSADYMLDVNALPSQAGDFERLYVGTGAAVTSSTLLENEVAGKVLATPLASGPVVHLQDCGAFIGLVRKFGGVDDSIVERVLPRTQLFD